MLPTQQTFRFTAKTLSFLVLVALVLAICSLFLGNDLALPWYNPTTYVKTPLFLKYFSIGEKAFGLEADQILAWQHFSTANFKYLSWLDYTVLTAFFIALVCISVTLTYLPRQWYLFCTGLMLLILMQLNLPELGFLPDYITYIYFALFAGLSYYFQSIRSYLGLSIRTLVFTLTYVLFGMALALLAPILVPASATVAFGLFAPLLLALLLMVFVCSDTMQVLFSIATKNNPNGKNGLIHFMSIGLIYTVLLVLLFLQELGEISLDLWLINPYVIFMVSLLCGYLSLDAKLQVSDEDMPTPLIKRWLFPALALLSLCLIGYIELGGNDSLSQAFQLSILGTQLAGAVIFYCYTFINFTPQLLSNEKVPNFFAGFRAPLLTARALVLVFSVGIYFYLGQEPYYQARAGRYIALGALAESIDSDLLAEQYYQQANFYDYYNFKGNYSLARIARRADKDAGQIDFYKRASLTDVQNKATIALANFYSDRDQLFNKLLVLKDAREPNHRLTNNLSIAHYEFAHYDSSQMALNRSLATKVSDEALVNQLALEYYVPTTREGEENFGGSKNSLINLQAIANKEGTGLSAELSLSPDTSLLQKDLFALYNMGLSRQGNSDELLNAFNYYLAARRNSGMKDFLLLGQAFQAYHLGQVNRAFKNVSELMVIDAGNRYRHAFTLGLWAAHQGAYNLAIEQLSTAIEGNYRADDAYALLEAMQNGQMPTLERAEFPKPSGALNAAELAALKTEATKNAFDTPLTLGTIAVLKAEGVSAAELYELLRANIVVNPYSLELMTAFALQSVEAGLTSFGRNGLLSLRDYVSEAEFDAALTQFEAYVLSWREKLEAQ